MLNTFKAGKGVATHWHLTLRLVLGRLLPYFSQRPRLILALCNALLLRISPLSVPYWWIIIHCTLLGRWFSCHETYALLDTLCIWISHQPIARFTSKT